MKILIDLTSLDDNFSGIERFALNISKNLIMQDSNNKYILVFKNKIHNDFQSIIDNSKIVAKVLKGKNKLIFNQIILPYNLYKIKADKYLFLAFPSPILFRRKNIINTIHDLTAFLYPETMDYKSMLYFKYSIKNAVKISETILTVSKSSMDDIIDKFNVSNIYIIYNGISEVFENFKYDKNTNEKIIKKYNLENDYFLSLCTVEPRKNIKLLLEAYSHIIKNNKKTNKLVLAGRRGWKFEEIISNIDKTIIDENVIFTGFIDEEELPYIYINASKFIFPSLYEGFGIPIIEAGYLQVPIIISDIKSSIEVTNKNAIIFKNNNMNDLEDKLLIENSNKIFEKTIKLKEHIKKYKWENESIKLLDILYEGREK